MLTQFGINHKCYILLCTVHTFFKCRLGIILPFVWPFLLQLDGGEILVPPAPWPTARHPDHTRLGKGFELVVYRLEHLVLLYRGARLYLLALVSAPGDTAAHSRLHVVIGALGEVWEIP